MAQWMRRFWNDDDGQDIIEYSLLITFIVIACMWFVGASRGPVNGVWTTANGTISTASTAGGGG
jgi:Flp pilus assembly pilin Flp